MPLFSDAEGNMGFFFSLMPTSFWTVTHLSTTVILNQTISI